MKNVLLFFLPQMFKVIIALVNTLLITAGHSFANIFFGAVTYSSLIAGFKSCSLVGFLCTPHLKISQY